MVGGVAAWGDSVLDLREGVCVLCVLCVCMHACAFGDVRALKGKARQLRAGPCHGPTAAYTVLRRDRPKARRPADRLATV